MTVAVVGAGAAGLMAAIEAGRTGAAVIALDGARTLGAKILVAGGGRCNVTHHAVDERAFAGSTRPAIRKVLRRFDVAQTVQFFADLGVALKREDTGKLFPVTDRARTVLDALLMEAERRGVPVVSGERVLGLERESGRFVIRTSAGVWSAAAAVLATGGRSLPKTGSDGAGYDFARGLGHGYHDTTPALVPLIVGEGPHRSLTGVSLPAELTVAANGERQRLRGALLWTHFGVSGPVALDASRHWHRARLNGNVIPRTRREPS